MEPRARTSQAKTLPLNTVRIPYLPSNHSTSTSATMAPKKPISTNPSPAAVPASSAKQTHAVSTASSGAGSETKATKPAMSGNKTASSTSGSLKNAQDAQEIAMGIWNNYVDRTPQRVKLLDVFMVFLMTVGLLQFVYVVLVGNYVSDLLESLNGTMRQEDITGSFRERAADQGGCKNSRSTPSSPASRRRWANSCSQLA